MKKKWIVYISITIIIIISIVLALVMLDEAVSKLVSILLVLALVVWILIKGLETLGNFELLSAMGFPALFPIVIKILSEFGITARYRDILSKYLILEYDLDGETSTLITLWIFLFLFCCWKNSKDNTALKKHKGSDDEEFREKNFAEKSEKFCKALRQRIEEINRETDWNEDLFTPIDAEVEVCIGGKQKKKYDDLLKCLRSIKHKGAIFLVLGEPGSGKSVALRKLCLELLQESKKTKKIPVYINLKKWNVDWSLNNIPDKRDLIEFIRTVLYEKGDILTDDFLDSYFQKMLEDGRWYFIFDSFDEMPCLMGKKNCQELIDKISELLYQFMSDTNQSGGIIASRLFKAPSEAIGATVTLKIQAFNDIKIKSMIQKYLNNSDEVVKELFGKREELVVLCRNPFYLSLLISYVRERDVKFPENQMELYQSFVNRRLQRCSGKLESEGITAKEVHEAAKKIAVFMHESDIYGLECPITVLIDNDDEQYWRKVLRLLEYAKLCRYGGQEDTVSFVHRRFQEFFLVERIIESGIDIESTNYESIVNNSHMRDALVLYCEVAEEENARDIAEFCWGVVKENIAQSESIVKEESIKLVNTLYFMAEAFRNRKQAIFGFVKEYEGLVEQYLDKKTDFIVRYALTNSMVLFEQEYLQKIVRKVFELKNRWLSDVVMQNSRIISELDADVERQFIHYLGQIDRKTFWKRFRNVNFSLSLSKKFGRIQIIHFLLLLIDIVNAIAIVLLSISLLMNLRNNLLLIADETERIREIGIIGLFNYSVVNKPEWNYVIVFAISFLCSFFVADILCVLGKRKQSILIECIMLLSLVLVYDKSIGIGLAMTLGIPICAMILCLLSHKIYYIKTKGKKVNKWDVETVVLSVITLLVVVAILIIPEKIIRCLLWLSLIALTLSLGIIVWMGVVYLITYIKDRKFVLGQVDLKVISRKRMQENLAKIHRQKWKRQYISNLLHNKVELTGEWAEESRVSYDDELEFMLAKLECTRNDSLSYWL